MPKPGVKLTDREAAEALMELASMAQNYPIGRPHNVTVTLTDEQWIAVSSALGVVVVHRSMEGTPDVFPEWMDEKQREAMFAIHAANVGAITGGLSVIADLLSEEAER
jgi:hypothetical protein